MLQKRLLFLTLNTFSSTGGIEKVCRIAGKALHDIAGGAGYDFEMYSMYDHPRQVIEKYVPRAVFEAFSGKRISFIKESVKTGRNSEVVILSHVNLLIVGFLIKLVSPKTKVCLIAHGIEVWRPFPAWKRRMLKKLDQVLPVSEFTCQKMISLYGLNPSKLTVLNNCLDPFLTRNIDSSLQGALKEEFGFEKDDVILFTLTRLKSSEQYKGYDRVIAALPAVLEKNSSVKYLIAGKYDDAEKKRLDELIQDLNLNDRVVFSGFAEDEQIEKLFTLSDVYVMPSSGEGFGIVFIEALFYGKPVVAGNADGSVDALDGGKLGLLVDPFNKEELIAAVEKILKKKRDYMPNPITVESKFGFSTYRNNFRTLLNVKELEAKKERMPSQKLA